jgi:hypothetical protein
MLRRIVVSLAVGFAAVSAVNALSVNSYRDEKNDDMRKINKAYLAGVRDGIVAVNHAIVLEGKKPYFCLPDAETLRFEQAEEILMQEGKKRVHSSTCPFGPYYLRRSRTHFHARSPANDAAAANVLRTTPHMPPSLDPFFAC